MTQGHAMTDLAAIRALCEKATPGPWRQGNVEKHHVFANTPAGDWMGHEYVLLRMNVHFPHEHNAAFIAAAREAVPQLLALVEEQGKYIAELEASLARWERVAERDQGKPFCSCTYEAGDSRCIVHPRCNYCGAVTDIPRDSCSECRHPSALHPTAEPAK